jgi:hypothetical protein
MPTESVGNPLDDDETASTSRVEPSTTKKTAKKTPGHDNPSSHDKPTHDKPTHDKPTHDKPTHDKPTHDKPTHDKPTHDKPTHDHPFFKDVTTKINFIAVPVLRTLWQEQLETHGVTGDTPPTTFTNGFLPHMQAVGQHIVLRAAEFTSHCGRSRIMPFDLAQACAPYVQLFSGCYQKNKEYFCKAVGTSQTGGGDDEDGLCGSEPSQCGCVGEITCLMGGGGKSTTRRAKRASPPRTRKKYEGSACKKYVKQHFNLTWTATVLQDFDNIILVYVTNFVKGMVHRMPNKSDPVTVELVREQVSELKKHSPYLTIIERL